MRSFCPLICVLLFQFAAAPATKELGESPESPSFWLHRATVDWKGITDPLQKPWTEMADAQWRIGDRAGLRRTLNELLAQTPPAGLKGWAYAKHPIVVAYANLAGAYAWVGDVQGMRRAMTVASDRSRSGGDGAADSLDELRVATVESLIRADRFDDALAIARDLSDARREVAAKRVAGAREALQSREREAHQVRADLARIEETLDTDPNVSVNAGNVAMRAVLTNDQETLATLDHAIAQAKQARSPRATDPNMATPGTVMLTPGQNLTLSLFAGTALGNAMTGDAAAARRQLEVAATYLRSIDRQPLALAWYRNWHVPVVQALIERGQADDALAIAESFPTKAQRPSDASTAKWELEGLQRVLAHARAAASKQRDEAGGLNDGRPQGVTDLRNLESYMDRRTFPKFVGTIDQMASPSERCRANLAVALRITQPAKPKASTTSPATQPLTAQP
jgi:hypothetical protein